MVKGFYTAGAIWDQRSWPSVATLKKAKLRWVDWFNNHRL
jgi:putative transposase